MAHVYIRSLASGTNDGSSKTNAYTTAAAALTAKAAGDNFWVASDHAETQASAMTLTSPGTLANPCTVMCVDFAGSTPPVSADLRTTGTITTTGNFGITFGGSAKYRGLTISAGTGAVNAKISFEGSYPHAMIFEQCVLRKLGTSGNTSAIQVGFNYVHLYNTQIQFGNTGDAINISGGGYLKWTNTATPVLSVFPDLLFYSNTYGGGCWLEGLDFSDAGFSGKTLFATIQLAGLTWNLVNCKKHASLTEAQTPEAYQGGTVVSINSDSAGTNYRHGKTAYSGSHTVETSIVRTGGASDGVTPIAWKIITNANTKWLLPFESLPLSIKNNTTGANVTVTIFGIWGGGSVPTTRDIWPVISYFGSSGSPLATIVSGGAADYLAAATNWATDTSTWGGSTTKFKMAVTLSSPQPQLKGPIYVTICASAASSTFYVDPKPVLT